jgi:hypothetical protein
MDVPYERKAYIAAPLQGLNESYSWLTDTRNP